MSDIHLARPTAPWPNLRLRSDLLHSVRCFFRERGFCEVETPLLSADTVVDRRLDPLRVVVPDDPAEPELGRTCWLQTSPELGMKRLLAAHAEPIFQLTRAFRAGEVGPLHNVEFTIVEWYRPGDDMPRAIDLLRDLIEHVAPWPRPRAVSYAEAFRRALGLDPLSATLAELRSTAAGAELAPSLLASDDRDDWLDWLMAFHVQPRLGAEGPEVVYHYPASQAALARVAPGSDPPVAERFELFFRGVELANGYHELLDAEELERRAQLANRQRVADGKPALPTHSRLVEAMRAGLPACSGVALGFDRLAMLLAGAESLDQIIALPSDRA